MRSFFDGGYLTTFFANIIPHSALRFFLSWSGRELFAVGVIVIVGGGYPIDRHVRLRLYENAWYWMNAMGTEFVGVEMKKRTCTV